MLREKSSRRRASNSEQTAPKWWPFRWTRYGRISNVSDQYSELNVTWVIGGNYQYLFLGMCTRLKFFIQTEEVRRHAQMNECCSDDLGTFSISTTTDRWGFQCRNDLMYSRNYFIGAWRWLQNKQCRSVWKPTKLYRWAPEPRTTWAQIKWTRDGLYMDSNMVHTKSCSRLN